MSAAGRPGDERAPARIASRLREAGFVRLVGAADGDALAAAGLLARALDERGVPYQASLAAVPDPPATEADCTVAVGHDLVEAGVTLVEPPLAPAAADVVAELAPDAADPTLALAGAAAAGVEPAGRHLEAAGLERRPGVAVPTDDPVAGLVHSTLVHAAFSGEEATAAETFGGLEEGRELASAVALAALQDAPPRAADAVGRMLRPYVCDRFGTLGGFADVLDAAARLRPGTGVALALGHDAEASALSAWRQHGARAHAALRAADTGRYDGVLVARVDDTETALLGTVARLLFEYRSPEPAALVVTDGAAAVAADGPVETPFRTTASRLEGRAAVRNGAGTATFEGAGTEFVAAFRGEL